MGAMTAISPAPVQATQAEAGDFVQGVEAMARQIDRRLRLSLSPQQYAMVQDLVLATRITTIARDSAEVCVEPTAA